MLSHLFNCKNSTESNWRFCRILYIYVLFIPFEFSLTKGGETKHELHIKNQVNTKTKSSLTSLFGDEKPEKNRHNTAAGLQQHRCWGTDVKNLLVVLLCLCFYSISLLRSPPQLAFCGWTRLPVVSWSSAHCCLSSTPITAAQHLGSLQHAWLTLCWSLCGGCAAAVFCMMCS